MYSSLTWRRILCCFLCCVILLFCIVRPVFAFEPITMAVVGVGAFSAIGSILIAIGVLPDSTSNFNILFRAVMSSLPDEFQYIDDAGNVCIKLLSIAGSHYARHDLIESIIDILFTQEVASRPLVDCVFPEFASIETYSSSLTNLETLESENANLYPYYTFSKSCSTCYQVTLTDNSYSDEVFIWTSDPVEFASSTLGDKDSVLITFAGPVLLTYYHKTLDRYSVHYFPDGSTFPCTFEEYCSAYSVASSEVSYLSSWATIGNLAEDLDDEEYATWGELRLVESGGGDDEDPDDDDDSEVLYYWPVTVTEPDEFPSLSQKEAQLNTVTYPETEVSTGESVIVTPSPVEVPNSSSGSDVDSDSDSDADSDSNPDSDPDSDPDTDPDADPDVGSDGSGYDGTFGSSGSPSASNMTVDLRNFFPFCIPFDLYKMLSALQASPVAPSFTFAIPFLGQLYEFQVDLSAWNGVAQTVRSCEVVLFCVGLIMGTRKYIKW